MKRLSSFFLTTLLLSSFASSCTPATALPSSTPSPVTSISTPTPTITPLPLTATPTPRVLLPVRGIVGPFERRGYPGGYFEGGIINEFNNLDPVVGTTVAQEVALQLDAMRDMGINTISLTLAAADPHPGPFIPPQCTVNPDLGLQWPQPTELELTNLKALFDLVQSKSIRIILNLSITHMEEQPPTNSETWVGSILQVVKDHPALDLVMFGGDAHTHSYPGIPVYCGGRAEAAFWEGPDSVGATYVKWAISYAHSLGLPYQKLSAEAIIGDYYTLMQPPNQYMTDGHFWDPITVLKGIFDDLSIPNDQRTYALSFYEHRKCATAKDLPCVDANPHEWAIETIAHVFDTIGRGNGARLVAVETGLLPPVEPTWTTEMALESLVWIMQNYGIDGGCFWRWTDFSNTEELDPTLASPIKQRGIEFTYNPVKDILQQLYTQGQTNDLSLTPDTVPPVFSSVSAMPSVVKNGDTLEIFANLGEPHLFVWAELSSLDSDKTSLVLLMDQGDGTYTRRVNLSPWNVVQNGIKNLKITAMDFWSNTSSTSVEDKLNNPAPVLDSVPPDDTFDGNVLDPAKWQTNLAGGATVTQDGRLVFSTSSSEAYSSGTAVSAWYFPGDFDVQVDFQIGEGWASPATEHLDGAVFGLNIAGQSYLITRLRSSGEDKVFSLNSADALSGEMATIAVTGRYRLIRSGTTLAILFDVGTGWQKIFSHTVATDPTQVYLGNGSINASQAFTTYFDNFRVNSGLTTYKP